MTDQTTNLNSVQLYLAELRAELRDLRVVDQQEFIDEIAEHIRESSRSLNPSDEIAVRKLLSELGTPTELAHAYLESESDLEIERGRGLRRLSVKSRLIILLVGIVISTAVGLLVWADHYQPLDVSGFGISASRVTTVDGKLASKIRESNTNLPLTPTVWRMPSGGAFVEVYVTLHNLNTLPIQVTSLGSSMVSNWRNDGVMVRFNSSIDWATGKSFSPFTLSGGQSIGLIVRQRFSCRADPGVTWQVSEVPVTTDFLGNSHELSVQVAPFDVQLPSRC